MTEGRTNDEICKGANMFFILFFVFFSLSEVKCISLFLLAYSDFKLLFTSVLYKLPLLDFLNPLLVN